MTKNKAKNPTSISLTSMLENAYGKIPYNMTNDYMFRAVLQSNNKVLRGLICSLLHLKETEVYSVEITNPVILGEAVHDKEIRLDISLKLNNKSVINLDYSDFRFIPINLSKDHFHETSIQVCRNNYSNNLAQAGR